MESPGFGVLYDAPFSRTSPEILGAGSYRPHAAIASKVDLRGRPVEIGIFVGVLAIPQGAIGLRLQAADHHAPNAFSLQADRLEQRNQPARLGSPGQAVAAVLAELPAVLGTADLQAERYLVDGEADRAGCRQERPGRLGRCDHGCGRLSSRRDFRLRARLRHGFVNHGQGFWRRAGACQPRRARRPGDRCRPRLGSSHRWGCPR